MNVDETLRGILLNYFGQQDFHPCCVVASVVRIESSEIQLATQRPRNASPEVTVPFLLNTCDFLIRKIADQADRHDVYVALSCAKELFETVREAKLETDSEDLSILQDFLHGIIKSSERELAKNEDVQMNFLYKTCMAAGVALLPHSASDVLNNSIHSLATRVEVATLLLQHPQMPHQFTPLFSECLESSVDAGEVILRFLTAAAQSKLQRCSLATVVASKWEAAEEFLCRQSGTEDSVVFCGMLLFVDSLFDYAEELFLLSKVEVPTVFVCLSLWIAGELEKLTSAAFLSHMHFVATFGSVAQIPSCSCRLKQRIVSLLLKCMCVFMRGTKFPELMPKFWQSFNYLRAGCLEHACVPFPRFLCLVFSRDDGALCSAMLCALHVHLLIPQQRNALLYPEISPEECFDAVLTLVYDDHYVLVSWITDNQNCFLVYFLQYLKHVSAGHLSERQKTVLEKIEVTVNRLFQDGKVSFNPTPLLRRLQNILQK